MAGRDARAEATCLRAGRGQRGPALNTTGERFEL